MYLEKKKRKSENPKIKNRKKNQYRKHINKKDFFLKKKARRSFPKPAKPGRKVARTGP